MAKYIDIFTDFGFKKIFGEEANKILLIDFINAVLPDISPVKDLSFKNNEQQPASPEMRRPVYDIYCTNERGESFIVELQKNHEDYFIDRTIYYGTFPISDQAQRGLWDYNLKAVYCIAILDFKLKEYEDFPQKRVVHTLKLKDDDNINIFKKIAYIYIEMPYFNKEENELETRLDKWLYFIRRLEDFQAIPEIFKGDIVFEEAIKKAEIANLGDAGRADYRAALKVYRDIHAERKSALNQGIREGLKIGEEKLKQKEIEIVIKCIKKGMSISDIADLTGLSEDEINNIKA